MYINPVTISLIALAISGLSFFYFIYTGCIQHRYRVEQMRLNTHSTLLKAAFAVRNYCHCISMDPSEQANEAAQNLTKLADAILDVKETTGRQRTPRLIPAWFSASVWQEVLHNAQEILFFIEGLKESVDNKNYAELSLRSHQIELMVHDRKDK